jgi:hypothetical protein
LRKIFGSNPAIKNSEIVSSPVSPCATLLAARKNFSEVKEKSPCLKEDFSLVDAVGLEPTAFSV